MKAFLGNKEVKQKYVQRVKAHFAADQIVKGKYWENGKGCAVGCTIHSSDHKAYESKLGIPEWLAHVEDKLFEGMPNVNSQKWPLEFLQAIRVGANLESIKRPFLVFIVQRSLKHFDHTKYPDVANSIKNLVKIMKAKKSTDQNILDARKTVINARYADADAAAYAAAYAAIAAAYAAADAYADAYAAAAAAAYAAIAAAYAAARQKEYLILSRKLLTLLKECK